MGTVQPHARSSRRSHCLTLGLVALLVINTLQLSGSVSATVPSSTAQSGVIPQTHRPLRIDSHLAPQPVPPPASKPSIASPADSQGMIQQIVAVNRPYSVFLPAVSRVAATTVAISDPSPTPAATAPASVPTPGGTLPAATPIAAPPARNSGAIADVTPPCVSDVITGTTTCIFQVDAVGNDAGNSGGTTTAACSYSYTNGNIYFGECETSANLVSGFRFATSIISQDTSILAAHVEFTVDGPYDTGLSLAITGGATDEGPFSSSVRPDTLTPTAAEVPWGIPVSDAWTLGEQRTTPDLTPILNELLHNGQWTVGDAVNLVFRKTGSVIANTKQPNPGHHHRRVIGFNRDPAHAARLVLTFGAVLPDDQVFCPVCSAAHPSDGDPIDTRSGNFWTSLTDLIIQTPGPALVWKRSYASQATGSISGTLGRGWTHPYAAHVILPSPEPDTVILVSPLGNRERFRDLGAGSYEAFPGIFSTLTSDSNGYVQTQRDQSQWSFDLQGRLMHVQDAQGRLIELTYAGTPERLVTISDAADSSRALSLTSTVDGFIETVSDGTRTVTYSYTGEDLTGVTDVMNRATTYYYDNHLLTGIDNALGQPVVRTTYDGSLSSSKAILQTLQNGRTLQLSYAADSTVVTTTNSDGSADTKTFFYNARNTITGVEHNGQAISALTFSADFEPAVSVDGNNNVSQTQRNAAGLPITQIDALGHQTLVRYDDQNRPISTTNALGITTLMRYDAYSHVISTTTGITTTSPIQATSLYTYTAPTTRHPAGLREAQSGPDGVVTHYTYDSGDQGLVVEMTVGYGTPLAQTTAYAYDALGRRISTTIGVGTALSRTTMTDYNADTTIARSIQNYGDGVFDAGQPDQDLITTYGYDLVGRTVAVTDTLGVVSATHYNVAGQVDWTARNLTPFVLDAAGQPEFHSYSASTPDANVATLYGYDGLGRTVLVTETGILTGSFDLNSTTFSDTTERVTRTEYDELSRPITVTLNYDPGQPVDTLSDVNVRTLTYYDGAGNVIWQRDALGRWTATDYDALNRPITVTLNYENGNPLTLAPANSGTSTTDTDLLQVTQYDAQGRMTQQIENAVDGVFTITEPITDRITLFEYDTLGRAVTTTLGYDPPSLGTRTDTNRTRVSAYDPISMRLMGSQDALGRWVSQQYDALGRVTQTIQNCRDAGNTAIVSGCEPFDSGLPDHNVVSETRYDELGRTFEIVDPLGHVSRTLYDGVGRSTTTIRNYEDGSYDSNAPDTDVTTSQSYDALGRSLSATDAVGAVTFQGYNPLGQTVVITDAMDRVTTFGYDGSGTQRWQRRADNQGTVQLIDGLGRTTTTIVSYGDGVADPNSPDQDLITQTTFDRAGRQIATTAPDGRVTRFAYDLHDHLIGVTENAQDGGCAVDPCNVVTTYTYDRLGNRTAITDARNHTRRFAYDAANQQVTATDALNQTTSWSYDAAGRVTDQDDPRGSDDDLAFRYDDLDRPIQTTAVDLDAAITSQYDALGRRTALSDGTGTTGFGYDALGRVTQIDAPTTGTLLYGYNGRGDRTMLIYPDSSVVESFTNPDGQLQSVFVNGYVQGPHPTFVSPATPGLKWFVCGHMW